MGLKIKGRNGKRTDNPFFNRAGLLIALVLVGCILLVGFNWADRTVTLSVNGDEREIQTFALTVGQLLEDKNIGFTDHDKVSPRREMFLQDGMKIAVEKSVQVWLNNGGTKQKIYTFSDTVRELLDEYRVSLQEEDRVIPSPQEGIQPGMTVEIVRQNTQVVTEEIPVPNQVIKRKNSSLPMGKVQVAQEGHPGLKKRTWEITFRNGREYNRRLLNTEVIREPLDRILEVGNAPVISRGGRNFRYRKSMEMEATAYTYTGNNTALGVPPKRGTVAVDPRVIPMGTRLFVEGYGLATAGDRGSAIKGNRIDLFMETRSKALRWGRRSVKVYVLE